jgi:transposase InsO family protein
MYMMKASHDHLGHRGTFATKELIGRCFWWPEFERDVNWYVKTCHQCQVRQKTLLKNPPTVTHTPGLFQVLHADTMHMTPASNGCKYIVHGRCALSSWMEGRPLRKETARTVGLWMFEDIVCRWGSLIEIVTDNGSVFKKAVAWLESKYGIKGVTISPYNSQASGKIE